MPSWLVTVSTATLVSSLTTLTCAPGIAPPVESFTMPVMVLVLLWANSATGRKTAAVQIPTARTIRSIRIRCLPHPRRGHAPSNHANINRSATVIPLQQPIDERGEKLEGKNLKKNRKRASHLAIDGPVHMHRHAVDAAPGRQPRV